MTAVDFPVTEFEARLERAQRAMHTGRLDALLITTEPELRWFTGFRTLFWQSPTRPWFLVVPRQGKPIAVIPEIGAALMRATWLDDIRTWQAPDASDDGISLLAGALGRAGRIGMAMGHETSLRMPLMDFRRLTGLIPGEIEDATGLIQHLRQIKSPAEIAVIERICTIASDTFDQVPALVHAGQPLNEAFRAFKIALLSNGADDVPYLVGGADQGGYEDVISPPGTAPLDEGDVLMLDTGATLRGYFCDFDRNFAMGRADEAARTGYRTLWQATEAALAAARPGATMADLFRTMAGVIDQGAGDVGRLGHGLGMQLTETPSIIGHDRTVLRPGMVLTLEPSMTLTNGRMMVHEENIVIEDGPARLLTRRAAMELPVL